jgi:hypothetical protein
MDTSATVSWRRPPSRIRENHSFEHDFSFVAKRNRDGPRDHVLSDDDEIPASRGEKHRRKKKHTSSSLNTPSTSGPRPGPSTDTFVDRSHKSSKQKHGMSSSLSDVPTNIARTVPRGMREVSREGRHSSAKAPSVPVISDDEAGPQSTYGGPIVALEFNRMKRESEALKKVCFFFIYVSISRLTWTCPASSRSHKNHSKAGECGWLVFPPRSFMTSTC